MLQWWRPRATLCCNGGSRGAAFQGAVFQSVAAEVPTPQVWQPRAVLPWWQPGAVLRSMAAEEAALQRRQPRAALQLWQPRGCKLRCAEKRINRWDVDEFSHSWMVGGADWEVSIFSDTPFKLGWPELGVLGPPTNH